jgi:hypothetical protein
MAGQGATWSAPGAAGRPGSAQHFFSAWRIFVLTRPASPGTVTINAKANGVADMSTQTANALAALAQTAEQIAARHYERNTHKAADAAARGDYDAAAKYARRAARHAANLDALRGAR